MADEPRYADEIRIPVTIQVPWSGKLTPEGQPWPMDARGRDWPSHRDQPECPIDQLPKGFAPGTAQPSPGDGRSLPEQFAAMDAAMNAEIARARQSNGDVQPVADRNIAVPAERPAAALSSREAFDHGLASSPRADAITLPQDHDSLFTPTTLRDASGAPVRAATGDVAQSPVAYSPDFFRQRGREDAPCYAKIVADWQALQQQARNATSAEAAAAANIAMAEIEARLRSSPLAKFGQGKTWDAQRPQGTFVPEFRDAATIYIGIYGAAAGIPEDMMQQIQNDYATFYSKFGKQQRSKVYPALPETNVANLHIGYEMDRDSPAP